MNEIKEKYEKEIRKNKKPEKQKIEEIELKLQTLSKQIYNLQMKQISESIIRIQKEQDRIVLQKTLIRIIDSKNMIKNEYLMKYIINIKK